MAAVKDFVQSHVDWGGCNGTTERSARLSQLGSEHLQHIILGRWISSFDLQFPQNPGFLPTAFLSCYTFAADFTFSLYQLRNKGGTFDTKLRSGTYTIRWDPQTGVAGGDIAITSSDHLVLRYLMRRSNEIHFIIDGANVPIPVAQGVMYKAELVVP